VEREQEAGSMVTPPTPAPGSGDPAKLPHRCSNRVLLDFPNRSFLLPRSPDRLGNQHNRYGTADRCRQTEEWTHLSGVLKISLPLALSEKEVCTKKSLHTLILLSLLSY